MRHSPHSRSAAMTSGIALFLLLLAIGLTLGHHSASEEQTFRRQRLDQCHNLLPTVREYLQPESLLQHRVLSLLRTTDRFDEVQAARLADDLQKLIGPPLKLVLVRDDQTLLPICGFSAPQLEQLQVLLRFLRESHAGIKPVDPQQRFNEALRLLFGRSIRPSQPLWNLTHAQATSLEGQPGTVFFHTGFTHVRLSHYFRRYLSPSRSNLPTSAFTGQLIAFVPHTVLSDDWLREQIPYPLHQLHIGNSLFFDWDDQTETLKSRTPASASTPFPDFERTISALETLLKQRV
ncbi:MAG TPA: hypothetical protein PKO06_10860, partial [Candidatus Ozemobacteraceae bacterium]|nr:hypothetical protein [Candidatus Ozemobacteraceae bacterium]